jgi:hypothetical protein
VRPDVAERASIRRRVVAIADISPVMSASIPDGSALTVSDVERVSRDLSDSWTVGLLPPGIVFAPVRPISEWPVTRTN